MQRTKGAVEFSVSVEYSAPDNEVKMFVIYVYAIEGKLSTFTLSHLQQCQTTLDCSKYSISFVLISPHDL